MELLEILKGPKGYTCLLYTSFVHGPGTPFLPAQILSIRLHLFFSQILFLHLQTSVLKVISVFYRFRGRLCEVQTAMRPSFPQPVSRGPGKTASLVPAAPWVGLSARAVPV